RSPFFLTAGLVGASRRSPFSFAAGFVASRPPAPSFFRATRLVLRFPQLAARKVFHLRAWILLLDPLKRGQQFIAVGRPESGRQPAGDDGPVGVTRWH